MSNQTGRLRDILLLSRTTVNSALTLACFLVLHTAAAHAETGYDLWLRYVPVDDSALREAYRRAVTVLVLPSTSATARVTRDELRRGFKGLLQMDVPIAASVASDGALVVGTPKSVPALADLGWGVDLDRAGADGYLIRSATIDRRRVTVIASASDVGALRGAFHFLRLIQTRQPVAPLDLAERPRIDRRLLNHWDNLDGTIERGYAGPSLWAWNELPGRVDRRIEDYARANASIGINGTVLNNVNAHPDMLTTPYLEKVAAIAGTLRPYGIKVYLSANFAAPRTLGKLPTADPLDADVARWWRDKAAEIYARIPDFGGFVVKANSEGQPGPQEYGRTHADGANVLADALAPHGGIVMWRAFVYDEKVDADRIKRAYLEFTPLDGRFRDNVIVQVKNGPLDFQPREPFSPLFGAMPRTPVMAELQITQEYLGQSNHLVYLAPMWKEMLDADTFASGPGSPVSRVIDGTLHKHRLTAIAGVANTGRDTNWTGHHAAQANWYAYGRLAWNSDLSSEAIAREWTAMTWGHAAEVRDTLVPMLLESRELLVDYSMPLGLHHLIGGEHYEPMPENADPRRLDWSAIYYHRASPDGIGVDRTPRGTNAAGQYRSPLREQWSDPASTPENLLLWFHRLPWDYRLSSGRTLWEGLVHHYTRGAAGARAMVTRWESLRPHIDAERYAAMLTKLQRQADDAAAWRDKCLKYFQQFSGRPWSIDGRSGGLPH
jgi:alpha-glucuronidase